MTKARKSVSDEKDRKAKAGTKLHEPTPRERAALVAHLARRRERIPLPRLKVAGTGNDTRIVVDHPDPFIGQVLLLEALGMTEGDFADDLLRQLGNVSVIGGRLSETALNFLVAVVQGMKPRDPVETMLVAQMAAIHASVMDVAGRLAQADHFVQAEFAEQALNKLSRTFAAQIDALKRYRSGGEQRVMVQHHHVNVAANQAQVNVGNASPGGGVLPKSTEQSHETPASLAHAPKQEMPCAVETNRETVPSGSGDGLVCLPQSRGRRGRPQRQ